MPASTAAPTNASTNASPARSRCRPSPPEPPSFADWPGAVLSAELLHGSLVRCGPGVRGVGWPEDPRTRAAALAPWLTAHRTAILGTAAWIWGAMRAPGTPLQFSAARGRGSFVEPRSVVRVREIRISPDERVRLGRYSTTGPARTVCDLLRADAQYDARHRIACRLLVLRVPGGRSAIASELEAGPPLGRKRALERLRDL